MLNKSPGTTQSTGSDKPTVLIVDQNPNDLQPLSDLLYDHAKIMIATSGQQALDVSHEMASLDLVMLSQELGSDDSLSICSAFKSQAHTKAIPLIMLVDNMAEEGRQAVLRAGANDYLDRAMTAQDMASRIKLHLELKYKTDLLTEIALLDPLTSIPSAERFNEYLDIEWRRGHREFTTLTLIHLAIDNFDGFIEQHGLSAADDVLKRISRLMQANCLRAADMVARFADEEFVALLPGTELDNAMLVAQKMLAAVRALNLANQESESGILTISVGVVAIEPSRDNKPTDLLAEAEEMLSQAQQAGGDEVQAIAV